MVRVRWVLVVLALSGLALPPAAHATFHFMSISELGAGFLGDPNLQFVELRLDAPGQTNLTNTRLTSFDKDGIATELLLTPSGVANGNTDRTVLYATAAFQTRTGIAPDFVIPAGIVGPSGMICWGAPGDDAPPIPTDWDFDKPENYVDCVAYGGYPHTKRPASGTATSLAPGNGVQSLTRIKNTGAGGSNDNDFALAAASPCNNANQCAVLAPTPNKAESKCRRAIAKASTKFAATYGQLLVGCETKRLMGKLTGACPDMVTAGKILTADSKRTKAISKACGTLTPAGAGFGVSCPGYTGSCAGPIASTADVSTCVDCGVRRGHDELIDTVYAAPPDPTIRKCQLTLGKAVVSHTRTLAGLLARCEDGVARGKITGACPDAKTTTKIAAKSTKLRSTLCKACGGDDRVCGGDDDVAPAALGITSCPGRTAPSGASCGAGAITALGGVVSCVECLADFESACGTALAARPHAVPAACSATP